MLTPVVGLGAGGHARVVLEVLQLVGGYRIVGLLDPQEELWETEVLGIPVLGDDTLLGSLFSDGVHHAFIGLGTVGNTRPRRVLYESVLGYGFQVVKTIHPSAVISHSASLGHGVTILAQAVVGPGAGLEDNSIVNTGAIVEHNCMVGAHVHVATGARLGGGVEVGEGTHIGIGATVRNGIAIGRGSIVGAGAVVVRDVPDRVVVVGVPARIQRDLGV